MPLTRALKFKLIVPRSRDGTALRQALWTTHRTINEAVAYYERQLIILRGLAYLSEGDAPVTEDTVIRQRDQLIDAARTRNHPDKPLTGAEREEVGRLLYQLYTLIVPSHAGEKGTAQSAKGMLDGLTSHGSQSGASIFEKIGQIPDWVDGIRNGEAEAFEAAQAWLDSDQAQARLKATGSPPGWVRKLRKSESDWPVAFVTDLDKKLKEAKGYPAIMKRLRELGLIPLFPPYLAPRIIDVRGTLCPWDRPIIRDPTRGRAPLPTRNSSSSAWPGPRGRNIACAASRPTNAEDPGAAWLAD